MPLATALWRMREHPTMQQVSELCACLSRARILRDGTISHHPRELDTSAIADEAASLTKLQAAFGVSTQERPDVFLLPVLRGLPPEVKREIGTCKLTSRQENFFSSSAGAQIGFALSGGYDVQTRTTPQPAPVAYQYSLLHLAVASGRPQLLRFLLAECKASVDNRALIYTRKPVVTAESAAGEGVVRAPSALENDDDDDDDEFFAGASVDLESLTRSENMGGWTPLHLACGMEGLDRAAVVATLLDHHADPTLRDYAGWTPVAHALLASSVAVIALLTHTMSVESGRNSVLNSDSCHTSPKEVARKLGAGNLYVISEYLEEKYGGTVQSPPYAKGPTPAYPQPLLAAGLPFFTTEGVDEALESANGSGGPLPADSASSAKEDVATSRLAGAVAPHENDGANITGWGSLAREFVKNPRKIFLEEEEPKVVGLYLILTVAAWVIAFSMPSELGYVAPALARYRFARWLLPVLRFLRAAAVVAYIPGVLAAVILAVKVPQNRRAARRAVLKGRGRGLTVLRDLLHSQSVQLRLCQRETPLEGVISNDQYSYKRNLLNDIRKDALDELCCETHLCMRCLAWRKQTRYYHCNRCGVCTPGLDHHCDFFFGCVGADTQRSFVVLVTAATVFQFCFLLSFIILAAVQLVFRINAFRWPSYVAAAVLTPSFVWMTLLAITQHVNIVENILVFEQIKGGYLPNFWRRIPQVNSTGEAEHVWQWRNPYDLGSPLKNVIAFWTNPFSRLTTDFNVVQSRDKLYIERLAADPSQLATTAASRSSLMARLGKLAVPNYKPPGHIKDD